MTEIDFIKNLVRPSLHNLKPYTTARDEFRGEASVFLDANENSLGSPAGNNLNRYPDPYQYKLKEAIAAIKGVPVPNIFLGNGSDEAIDLLYRIFCEPGKSNVIVCTPTYGMYAVSAAIHNVEVRSAPLDEDFDLDADAIMEMTDENTRLIFICSPNNPSGNSMTRLKVEMLLNGFNGLVVVDEAYINYARQRSFIAELTEYSNLVVLQTFSKAWGMAGVRLGMAFACADIIQWFNKVKPPYNINELTQKTVLDALTDIETVNAWIRETVDERQRLYTELTKIKCVVNVFPSDANFLLVKFTNAAKVFQHLLNSGIVVRDRSGVPGCAGCLRITVGSPQENDELLECLAAFNA